MIEIVFEAKGLEIGGAGAGQCHKSKDLNSCIGLDNDVAIEVELVAGAAGKAVFSMATVSKPGPVLVLSDGTEMEVPDEGAYSAAQLSPGADENFVMESAEAGTHVFTVPNFKASGRYLHFWFDVPDAEGIDQATATVRVLARQD
jgi:hypothetical protein